METSKHAELAVDFKRTNNCAQAILLAFQSEIGMDESVLRAMGSGFGSGMGGMEATCGALCGAAMAAGLMNKSSVPTKMLCKEMLQEFQETAGDTVCKNLKGIGTGKMLFSCDDCVRLAALGVEKRLEKLASSC